MNKFLQTLFPNQAHVNHRNKHTKMMHITNLGIHASSSLRIRPSIARK